MTTLSRCLALALFVFTSSAVAAPPRSTPLERAIADGVSTGELTAREASRVRSRQAVVRFTHIVMAADGALDGADRARLRKLHARTARTVWQLTHNRAKDHSRALASGR